MSEFTAHRKVKHCFVQLLFQLHTNTNIFMCVGLWCKIKFFWWLIVKKSLKMSQHFPQIQIQRAVHSERLWTRDRYFSSSNTRPGGVNNTHIWDKLNTLGNVTGRCSPCLWSTELQLSAGLSSLWTSSLLDTGSGSCPHTSSVAEQSHISASLSHPAKTRPQMWIA